MSSIALLGGTLVTPLETRFCGLYMKEGLITALTDEAKPADSFEQIDVSDCYVTPGLIDLQVNGTNRCNLWDNPAKNDLVNLSEDLLAGGVTSILPTLITADLSHLKKNIKFLKSMGAGSGLRANKWNSEKEGRLRIDNVGKDLDNLVRLLGVHLEGPCLSPMKPGVHPVEFIRPLAVETLEQIVDETVKLVTIAPETEVSADGMAIKYLQEKNIVTALGHSNATFFQAEVAFDRGVNLVTHIFNALPAVHHRAPGAVVAALLNDAVSCAIICDGLHVCQEMVKCVLKIKTKEKTVLVTDSAQIGTNEGGLVGSSITLNQAVVNLVQWRAASFADAILMATWNPAKVLNLHEHLGHLAVGKAADIVVCDKINLAIKQVFLRGKKIF